MDLIGKRVKHIKFGEGIILKKTDSSISVRFLKENQPRIFSYPMCFDTFLTALDKQTEDGLEQEISQIKTEKSLRKQESRKKAEELLFSGRMSSRSKGPEKIRAIPRFGSVSELIANYKRSLISEITYLRNTGGKRQKLYDGKLVQKENGKFIYSFEADDDLDYPDGTKVTIYYNMHDEDKIIGTILNCEDFTVIIDSPKNMGDSISSLEISAEPWQLMNSLIDRLAEIEQKPSPIVRALACDGNNQIEKNNRSITHGQKQAIQMSLNQPITFIWGPPGTGKTQTLAKIALEHIKAKHRVLMLSHSNVSVDGAIMRTDKLLSSDEKFVGHRVGTLVRYGYPKTKELLEHEFLTAYNLVIRNHPQLLERRQSLLNRRKKVSRESEEYVEMSRELTSIHDKLKAEEKNCVREAKFVATTVSKATVDAVLRDSKFDVVIFDEASMAYIPQIIFSASLAAKYFICMGDFRQLPPIVQSDDASILNADIFQYCGITDAVERGFNHRWLCMLDTQYRMHPEISDFASGTMYGGLLKSAKNMKKERASIVQSAPFSDKAIGFADLSGMMSVTRKVGDNSRINVLSAFISFSLALEAAQTHEVGIITPYRAQSRLLHAMAKDVAADQAKSPPIKLNPISCATVHQFQGSEKDVIIFDAVDCYRMSHPGILLTSSVNHYANRLFNVALTRARGKFIGVANIDYMENKKLSHDLMLEKLIESQTNSPSCSDGKSLISENRNAVPNIMEFFPEDKAYKCLLGDLMEAKHEICIDIPDAPRNDKILKDISDIVQKFKKNKRRTQVCIRAENKHNLPDSIKSIVIENKHVCNPLIIIDKEIVWFGMPYSSANFIAEKRVIRTKYRPLIRFKGKYTAASLYGFEEMNRTIDQSEELTLNNDGEAATDTFAQYVYLKVKCPDCGKPMKLTKSSKGKFFLACSNRPACKKTSLINTELIEEYLYRNGGTGQHCPKCNRSLEVKLGRYGVYVQCCGLQEHKYKLDEI